MREVVLGELRRKAPWSDCPVESTQSVVAALCVTFGAERVLGVFMNEASAPETLRLGRVAAERLGIRTVDEPLSPCHYRGCYSRRDDAIRRLIRGMARAGGARSCCRASSRTIACACFSLVVRSPDGQELRARMPHEIYLESSRQRASSKRLRKMLEYYHADRTGYAVAGTPNLLEYDQGFFVKNGDGAADVKPIAHLYKTQVYQLAEVLDIPEEIRLRPPTTDTYSLPQSQEEFYFSLPYDRMDACLYARNHGVPPTHVAEALGLTAAQIERVYRDIDAKRRGPLPPCIAAARRTLRVTSLRRGRSRTTSGDRRAGALRASED
jgi:NAD+ synthase